MTADGRRIAGLAAIAIAARCIVLVICSLTTGSSVEDLARLRDGASFRAYAHAVSLGPGGFREVPSFDRRAFPGYPLLLAATGGHRRPAVAIALGLLASAAAAVVTFLIYRDFRVGLAMALLTPSYLMYSSIVMSEPVFLAIGLAALWLGMRGRAIGSGLLFGVTAWIRPLAAPIGIAWIVARRRRRHELLPGASVLLLVLAIGAFWLFWWSGSLTSSLETYRSDARAYGNASVLTWPFHSLVAAPLQTTVAPWKIAYVWAHVAFVLLGIALLWRCPECETMSLWWLGSNTLAAVCIGGVWGFHEFHRFIVPALPPLFWAWRDFLPRRPLPWIALGLLSIAAAAIGLNEGL